MSDAKCSTGPDLVLDDPDAAVILKGPLADLQRACERLEENGIAAEIIRPQADPSGCCAPGMFLVVAREDVPAAYEVFDRDWRRGLTAEQIEALEAAAAVVIDPDAPETTCPACMTTFATGPDACPDCGLSLR